MIRVVRQGARGHAVVLALGLLLGSATMVHAAADEDTQTEDAREVAQVKMELKLESGRVVKLPGDFTVDWGVQNELAIEADGSNHEFSVMVERKGEGKKSKEVAITVGYGRDGEAIIAPYTFNSKIKKREVVRIEGGLAFAVTVTPKKVKGEGGTTTEEEEYEVEEPTETPRDKIEITEDENDPLGGLDG
ncbi:MAG: hypothetical protein AAF799_47775 [Myxococcota bacterium]